MICKCSANLGNLWKIEKISTYIIYKEKPPGWDQHLNPLSKFNGVLFLGSFFDPHVLYPFLTTHASTPPLSLPSKACWASCNASYAETRCFSGLSKGVNMKPVFSNLTNVEMWGHHRGGFRFDFTDFKKITDLAVPSTKGHVDSCIFQRWEELVPCRVSCIDLEIGQNFIHILKRDNCR